MNHLRFADLATAIITGPLCEGPYTQPENPFAEDLKQAASDYLLSLFRVAKADIESPPQPPGDNSDGDEPDQPAPEKVKTAPSLPPTAPPIAPKKPPKTEA